jgi:hypothetical protein
LEEIFLHGLIVKILREKFASVKHFIFLYSAVADRIQCEAARLAEIARQFAEFFVVVDHQNPAARDIFHYRFDRHFL